MNVIPKSPLILNLNVQTSTRRESFDSVDVLSQNQEVLVQPRKLMLMSCRRNQVQPQLHQTNNPECFYKAIMPIIMISQLFGILPISRSFSKNSKKLIYNIKSFKTFYSTIVLMIFLILIFKSIIIMLKTVTNMDDCIFTTSSTINVIFSILFHGSVFLQFLCFFMLPKKWINLMNKWNHMEKQLSRSDHSSPKLGRKFNTIFLIIIIVFIIDHTWWAIKNNRESKKYCNSLWADTNNSHINNFEEHLMMILGIYSAFTWNFSDIFIILVSVGLAERYKHLNKFVKISRTWNNHENYWNQLRINYSLLSNLVKETDHVLSPLIFVSITHNFLYICLQLFIGVSLGDSKEINILKTQPLFSLLFVVTKTAVVLYSVARINDYSKLILPIIYECPLSKFTIETDRLQRQLTSDVVELTGMKFFSITRGFILTIAGTIVTYEIILLQFSYGKRRF